MPEVILARAIRGLANAFGLSGERSGPPGLDLGLPAQPVVDLGAFARYGSARMGENLRGDGWWIYGFNFGGAAEFTFTNSNALTMADFPGKVDDVFWIKQFSSSLTVSVGGVFADFVSLQGGITYPTGWGWGPGTNRSPAMFVSTDPPAELSAVGADLIMRPANGGPWPLTRAAFFWSSLRLIAAPAGTSTVGIACIGQVLPRGVPPAW